MAIKSRITTSWPISTFWVFLSIILALLATYSFLQADWIVKKSLIVTNYYNESDDDNNNNNNNNNNKYEKLQTIDESFNNNIDSNGGSELLDFDYLQQYRTYNSSKKYDGTKRLVKVTKFITTIRFGTIGVCSSNSNTSGIFHCQLYDESLAVSSFWPMVTILGGSGCVTLCISAVLSLLAVALPSSKLRHRVATTIGHAQTVAVVLLFLSLLLFPLGFNSDFVHYHCGSSVGPFNIGDCEIGWAYALVLVCASLALYCPVLVKFTADIHFDSLPKYL